MPPTVEEIAYREGVRAVEGQAQDLQNYRTHVGMALTGGGIAAAFLGAATGDHGGGFWVAAVAFAALVVIAGLLFYPIDFQWSCNTHQLVRDFVDTNPQATPEFMMREMAVHMGDAYKQNDEGLLKKQYLQQAAFVVLGIEVLGLLANLIWG